MRAVSFLLIHRPSRTWRSVFQNLPIRWNFLEFTGIVLPMATRQILGPAVRAIREARDMRHGVLAQRANISRGYLTLIEQGSRRPTPEVISRLASALGVQPDAISYFAPEEDVA